MKYDIILADPAWPYNQRAPHSKANPSKFGGGASSQYPLMSFEDIYGLPVEAVAAKNSALLLWTVCPHLEEGIKTVQAWGFDYKTVFLVWEKVNADGTPWYGPGYYSGSNVELLLLGVRGSVNIAERGVYQVMREPHPRDPVTKKRIHSRKPEETYRRIHKLFGDTIKSEGKLLLDEPRAIRRAELFARVQRPGWDAYGLDIDGRKLEDSLGEFARKELEEFNARALSPALGTRKKQLVVPAYLERYRSEAPFDTSREQSALAPALRDQLPLPFDAIA